MNIAWRCLILAGLPVCLLVPGCLLVQPLDEAKTNTEANAGSGNTSSGDSGATTSRAGSSGSAGRAPTGSSGSPASGAGGGANGGAPSEVDFSLFTGTWTITSGSKGTDCGAGLIAEAVPAGGIDEFTLGTTSDLILDASTDCPLLVDVDNRTATGQGAQHCTYSGADGYDYDIAVQAYTFEVLGDGTANSTLSTVSLVTDPSTNTTATCTGDATFNYQR